MLFRLPDDWLRLIDNKHIRQPKNAFSRFRLPQQGFLMNNNRPPYSLWLAQAVWCALIALTLLWDWAFAPLHTGRALLLIKLLPLLLPLRGILRGRVYTYQYCSMLVLAYFCEGVMRWFDPTPLSRALAAVETALSAAFFVCCLLYLKQFKKKD